MESMGTMEIVEWGKEGLTSYSIDSIASIDSSSISVILWLDQGIHTKGRKALSSTNHRRKEEDGSPDQVGG